MVAIRNVRGMLGEGLAALIATECRSHKMGFRSEDRSIQVSLEGPFHDNFVLANHQSAFSDHGLDV